MEDVVRRWDRECANDLSFTPFLRGEHLLPLFYLSLTIKYSLTIFEISFKEANTFLEKVIKMMSDKARNQNSAINILTLLLGLALLRLLLKACSPSFLGHH